MAKISSNEFQAANVRQGSSGNSIGDTGVAPSTSTAAQFNTQRGAIIDNTDISATSPGTSATDLFNNFVKVATLGTQALDAQYRRDLVEEARAGVDTTNAEFGVDQAVDAEASLYAGADSVDPTSLPGEIRNAKKQLEKMTKAKNAGTVNESHYWARLEMQSRQLRSRYPGYRDEIDKVISGLTGRVPANALRMELRQEADNAIRKASEAQSSDARNYTRISEELAQNGTLPADFVKRQAEGKPYSYLELLDRQNYFAKVESDEKRALTRLELQTKVGTLNEKEAERQARQASYNVGAPMLENLLGSDIIKQVTEARASGNPVPFTPEQTVNIQNKLEGFRQNYDTAVEKTLGKFRPHMTPQAYDDLVKSHKDSFDRVTKGILTKDYNIVESQATYLKAIQDSSSIEFLTADENNRKLAAAKGILGDSLVMLTAGNHPEVLQSIARAVTFNSMGYVRSGNKTLSEAYDVIDNYGKDGRISDQEVSAASLKLTKESVGTLGDPRIDDKMKAITLKGMYTKVDQANALSKVDRDSRSKAFVTLANPEVANSIKKLSERTGDPTLVTQYSSWVKRNFVELNTQLGQDMNDIVKKRKYLDLSFDPSSLQFKIKDRSAGVQDATSASRFVGDVYERTVLEPQSRAAVGRLNDTMRALGSALAATGENPNDAIQEYIEAVNLNTKAPKEGPDIENTLNSFFEYVDKAYKEGVAKKLSK